MAKEIRGHAMPDPKVYVPTPQDPAPNQSGGTVPWASQAGGSGPNTGPGFAFDAEQLKALANKWDDLADKFRNARVRAEMLNEVNGPGLEYASEGNAERVRSSARELARALQQRTRYCEDMAERFRAANSAYRVADEEATITGGKSEGKFG
ncbi:MULTISPECIES: hypothetical protein [Prauserella]|uniref:hypothetical protein n=1 Tax=Prauserella TaxID=142577 RepID=UPI001305117C|nr:MULTISPECIES: hypothetical protein [Prauserella]